jgi:hypothetical protein
MVTADYEDGTERRERAERNGVRGRSGTAEDEGEERNGAAE